MFSYKEKKTLPYSNTELFSIVADIERYPEFLPWCKSVDIIQKEKDSVLSKVTIGNSLIEGSYVCRVKFVKGKSIYVEYVSGLLSNLRTEWRFKSKSKKSTTVEIEIEFEFKSKILNKAMATGLDRVSKKIMSAFEERAKKNPCPHKKSRD
ncbi:MAG: type II toxin-antitoxin system RatA family toxin [Alphaproteobacteria bacterium]|nr:type II toxin-antitoxin system RatA family toxin [Alphaproteobacteria bacterium]MCL2505094.1 type II toxin-antitoxin system RatA family toxin [Alphaproteobacteria bacterium]